MVYLSCVPSTGKSEADESLWIFDSIRADTTSLPVQLLLNTLQSTSSLIYEQTAKQAIFSSVCMEKGKKTPRRASGKWGKYVVAIRPRHLHFVGTPIRHRRPAELPEPILSLHPALAYIYGKQQSGAWVWAVIGSRRGFVKGKSTGDVTSLSVNLSSAVAATPAQIINFSFHYRWTNYVLCGGSRRIHCVAVLCLICYMRCVVSKPLAVRLLRY
ncbi:hypothetical protein B0T26DRAFT_56113 [Lasiosphaeria miniovina]|uniref:Uncharacterized protein n=1 Tax=Lasiosphaeria miniovina TaxID=1954250 RepID=A0AA40EG73_9PEZI|nr:uncharacterized protein B0T26DRAFT_56113 [Lasiosphaeria miniovina]KAK0734133.1 hypothetical protein B0T26DRAFT_56113 [Lasiosphaeria miniovina]